MSQQFDSDGVGDCVMAFIRWLDTRGFESYDPYDIWGTKYGLFSRRLYYRVPLVGIPLIAPLLLMEMIHPSLRSVLVKKERFPSADAQLALAFLNLYKVSENELYLDRAVRLGADLLRTSLPGYGGHCWGYPFDWQNASGLWRKNTPFITSTPYCYEAFVQLAELLESDDGGRRTEDKRCGHLPSVVSHRDCIDIAKSIARFVHDDLNDTPTSPRAAAASYSPLVHDKVINASAYRAFVLFDAAHRFALTQYLEKAEKNLQFVLEEQRSNGSWLYAAGTETESFIDHFHTCFVLKNLFKINQHLRNAEVRQALTNGYAYYRKALFHPDGMPRYFARSPRTQIVRVETYNLAEAITLGVLLGNEFPAAIGVARDLAGRLCREFQLPDGHFVTRVYRGGIRHTTPFLRWPQAQVFYALTSLLLAETERQARGQTWTSEPTAVSTSSEVVVE